MNGMKGMDEQRETVRLEHAQAARMYNVDRIDACISTGQSRYEGTLLYLSAGGMAMLAPLSLPLNLPVDLDLNVGQHRMHAQGLIKNRNRLGSQYRLGVQFTKLGPEDEAFLQLLYGPGGTYEEVDGLASE